MPSRCGIRAPHLCWARHAGPSGLLGESLIYLSLSPEHALARGSMARFIAFGAASLLATRGGVAGVARRGDRLARRRCIRGRPPGSRSFRGNRFGGDHILSPRILLGGPGCGNRPRRILPDEEVGKSGWRFVTCVVKAMEAGRREEEGCSCGPRCRRAWRPGFPGPARPRAGSRADDDQVLMQEGRARPGRRAALRLGQRPGGEAPAVEADHAARSDDHRPAILHRQDQADPWMVVQRVVDRRRAARSR